MSTELHRYTNSLENKTYSVHKIKTHKALLKSWFYFLYSIYQILGQKHAFQSRPHLIGYTNNTQPYHDQIDEWHSIEGDVPEIHESQDVHQYHADRDDDHNGREEVKTQQQEGDQEDGGNADTQVLDCVFHNGQVLLIEHVPYTGEQKTIHRPCSFNNS